ncbi:MAG: type IV pilus modification protein PilV [Burkholderiaceae bacterium]|jgi:type IV pilus assembly protein PilV|nr:type IV pilus modification protein PilV [Burkholderiaceae bacterium]
MPATIHAPRGITLIEVMVSVLLLTIGLLGAAAVQLSAARNNQSAFEQAQVAVQVQGMLDAMRNNLAGVIGGSYDHASWTCVAPTGTTLAQTDAASFLDTLRSQVNPSACMHITCIARDCTVGVRIDDSRGLGGSTTHVIEVRSTL